MCIRDRVLSQAQQYLHLSVPFYFFLSQIFIYRNAVQGMGIAMIPMFSGIVELILRTSAAVYLTEYFGYSGICYASPIAWLGSSLFLFALSLIHIFSDFSAGDLTVRYENIFVVDSDDFGAEHGNFFNCTFDTSCGNIIACFEWFGDQQHDTIGKIG